MEEFRRLRDAYEVLGDPHKRYLYNLHRTASLGSGGGHAAAPGSGLSDADLAAYYKLRAEQRRVKHVPLSRSWKVALGALPAAFLFSQLYANRTP